MVETLNRHLRRTVLGVLVKCSCFVGVTGRGEAGSSLLVANVILSFTMSIIGSKGIEEYSDLRYIDVNSLIGVVNLTFECVSLIQSTDDEVDRSLRQCATFLEHGDLRMKNILRWYTVKLYKFL